MTRREKPALGNGESIRYRSTDVAGNVESDQTSAKAKVDTAAPSTTDDLASGWRRGSAVVSLIAVDGDGSGVDRTTYEIIGADGTPGPTLTFDPVSRPQLTATGQSIRYRSIDVAGNVEADRTTAAVQIDAVAPSTTDDAPSAWQPSPVR